MSTALIGLSSLIQKNAVKARKLENATVKADAVSVRILLMGFRDSNGKLCETRPEKPCSNGSTSWYKIEGPITAIETIPTNDDVRHHPTIKGAIQLLVWVCANDQVKKWYRDSDPMPVDEEQDLVPLDAMEEEDEEEDRRIADVAEKVPAALTAVGNVKGKGKGEEEPGEKEEKKDRFKPKDHSKDTKMWVTFKPGDYVSFNVFGDGKKLIGATRGAEVSIEGFGAGVSIYMSKPNTKFRPDEKPEPRVGLNCNLKNVTFQRRVTDFSTVFSKLPLMSWFGIQPPLINVSFDVSRKGCPQDLRTIQGVELPIYAVVPHGPYVDGILAHHPVYKKFHLESLPVDSLNDFARESKDADDKQAAASLPEGIEPEQSQYPVLQVRSSFVPYVEDAEAELRAGTTKAYNIVTFVRNSGAKELFGSQRTEEYGPVMLAISPLNYWFVCKFNSSDTLGNKFNLLRTEEDINGGNVMFTAQAVSSNLHEYLGTHAFHPTTDYFKKKFEHLETHRGEIQLNRRYPHPNGGKNQMHDLVVGGSQNPKLVSVWNLSDYSGGTDHFFYPAKGETTTGWQLCALTSQYFPRITRNFTKAGQDEQEAIQREIGKLSPEECDKCLSRAEGAKYAVGPNVFQMFFMWRVYDDAQEAKVDPVAAAVTEEI